MKTQNYENYALGDFENVPNLPAQYNAQPRQEVVLIFDLSGSTRNDLPEMNKAGKILFETVQNDPDAVNRIELMIVGFGTDFKVLREFDTIEDDQFPEINECLGGTVYCPPIEFAIEQAVSKRKMFRDEGITTGKPMVLFFSDGGAADHVKLDKLGEQIRMLMDEKLIYFRAFGVENANMEQLRRISHPNAEPKYIKGAENYSALFKVLSKQFSEKAKSIDEGVLDFQLTIS